MTDDVDDQGDDIWDDIHDEDVDTDNEDPGPSEADDYKTVTIWSQLYARIQKLMDECVKFQRPQTRSCNRWRLDVAHLMV